MSSRRTRWLIALVGGATVAASVVALALSSSPPPSSASRSLAASADPTAGLQSAPAPWRAEYTYWPSASPASRWPPGAIRLPHPRVLVGLHQRPTDPDPDEPRHRPQAALPLSHPRQHGEHPHGGLAGLPVHAPAALHDLGRVVQRLRDRPPSRSRSATPGRLRQRPPRARSGYGTPASFPHRVAVTFPRSSSAAAAKRAKWSVWRHNHSGSPRQECLTQRESPAIGNYRRAWPATYGGKGSLLTRYFDADRLS